MGQEQKQIKQDKKSKRHPRAGAAGRALDLHVAKPGSSSEPSQEPSLEAGLGCEHYRVWLNTNPPSTESPKATIKQPAHGASLATAGGGSALPGAPYQERELRLVGALDALRVELALLQAAVHEAHSTGHPALDVLEGGGREAHAQLVTQDVPEDRETHGD